MSRGGGGSKSGLKKATWFVYGPKHFQQTRKLVHLLAPFLGLNENLNKTIDTCTCDRKSAENNEVNIEAVISILKILKNLKDQYASLPKDKSLNTITTI